MANEPVVLVENFYSVIQFPGHTPSADEEALGFEAWHVADGRRSLSDYWTSTTTNHQRSLKVTCDRVRAANTLALDRGHNLAGVALSVIGSNDNFTTYRAVWQGTVPTAITSPGDLDNTNGVVTEEGAFLVRFPTDAYTYWSLEIPALGAGILPQVVGAWLGLAWQPDFLGNDWGEDQCELVCQEQSSDLGWVGRTYPQPRRNGSLVFQLTDYWSYELARYHVQGHFLARGRPMWIVMDRSQAERAVLAEFMPGTNGLRYRRGWGFRSGDIGWREHEPRRPV